MHLCNIGSVNSSIQTVLEQQPPLVEVFHSRTVLAEYCSCVHTTPRVWCQYERCAVCITRHGTMKGTNADKQLMAKRQPAVLPLKSVTFNPKDKFCFRLSNVLCLYLCRSGVRILWSLMAEEKVQSDDELEQQVTSLFSSHSTPWLYQSVFVSCRYMSFWREQRRVSGLTYRCPTIR